MSTPRSPVGSGALALMASAASRIMLKLPIRLIDTTFWNSSSECAPFLPTILAAGATPAQFTRPKSEPSSSAAATALLPSASWVTSQWT